MSGENLGGYVLQLPIPFVVVRILGVSQPGLRQSLKLARPNLIPQKPLARMASVTSSTTPLAVSERFEARRRARLGLDVHAAAR